MTISNIYETILTRDEFDKLQDYEKKNMLQYWRTQYSNEAIRKGMKISVNTLYGIIKDLDLPVQKRGGNRGIIKKIPPNIQADSPTIKTDLSHTKSDPPAVKEEQPLQEIIIDGLHLSYNGSYTPEHIQNQLLKFASILDGETDSFYIELKISQKTKG